MGCSQGKVVHGDLNDFAMTGRALSAPMKPDKRTDGEGTDVGESEGGSSFAPAGRRHGVSLAAGTSEDDNLVLLAAHIESNDESRRGSTYTQSGDDSGVRRKESISITSHAAEEEWRAAQQADRDMMESQCTRSTFGRNSGREVAAS